MPLGPSNILGSVGNGGFTTVDNSISPISIAPIGYTSILAILSQAGVASLDAGVWELDLGPVALADSFLTVWRRVAEAAGETVVITQNAAGACVYLQYIMSALYQQPPLGASTPTVDGTIGNGETLSTGATAELSDWNVFSLALFASEDLASTTPPTWSGYTNSYAVMAGSARSQTGVGEVKALAGAHVFPRNYGPHETTGTLASAGSCSAAAAVLVYQGLVDPPYFFTGFEPGTLAGANLGVTAGKLIPLIVGTPTIDTVTPHNGGYLCRMNTTAAVCGVGLSPSTEGQATSPCVFSVAVRFRSALPGADVNLVTLRPVAGADLAVRFRTSDDRFVVGFADGTGTPAEGPTVTTATWYVITGRWTVGATIDWRVDAVTYPQFADSNAQQLSEVYAGWPFHAVTADVDFDDFVLSALSGDYPIDVAKVLLLRVDPAGTVAVTNSASFSTFTNNGTINSTFNVTTARDALDELPPSIGASADGIVQDATDTAGHVDIPLTTYTLAGGESPLGLRAIFCGWAVSGTAATLGFRIFNGTTEQILQAGTVDPQFDNSTTTPAWFAKLANLANFDTQAKLDAAQVRVGYSSDAAPDVGIQWAGAEILIGATPGPPAAAGYILERGPNYRR